MSVPDLETVVVPLTPDRWDALAALFSEGGDPRFCWCMFWRLPSAGFRATIAANQVGLRRLADDAAAGARPAPGLIALDGDRAVGWVSLGPRPSFERLERSRTIPRLDDRPVWSIVCFVVSATIRGRGLARVLLDGAVGYARAQGATMLEAYPVAVADERIAASAMYTGSLSLFTKAGFAVAGPTTSRSAGIGRVVVRLALDG